MVNALYVLIYLLCITRIFGFEIKKFDEGEFVSKRTYKTSTEYTKPYKTTHIP